jgi:hypothetical protein
LIDILNFKYSSSHVYGSLVTDFSGGPQKKRKGRGITKLPDIFSRTPDMPKIKILVNEYGQPVGENVKRFTRAIGCTVRRKLRVGYSDWRLVDAEKKFKVWTIIKVFYVSLPTRHSSCI